MSFRTRCDWLRSEDEAYLSPSIHFRPVFLASSFSIHLTQYLPGEFGEGSNTP